MVLILQILQKMRKKYTAIIEIDIIIVFDDT